MTKKEKIKTKQEKIIFWSTIVIGILLRILFLDKFPAGLNCDEASVSYNAFSILNTLSDRYGNFLPVYTPAFGGGQSVLLVYLSIPFVKLLGLNIIATRLPMAIISCISLIVFYKILKLTDFDDRTKFFSLLFFALNPWHIMKSRWGLDCNIFPDIMLIAIFFLIKYYHNRSKKNKIMSNNKFLYLFFIFIAISAYSYATSYVALSIFCITLFVYGIKTKSIDTKQILISILIILIITWPLIIFVIINFLNLPEIRLPFCTIPRLASNRMSNQSILASGNIFISFIKNIFATLKLLIIQQDGLYWNNVNGFGMYYLFSFPIFVIGVFDYIKNSKKHTVVDNIFALWLISGLIFCLFLYNININRMNFVIIPVIYFIIKGFTKIFKIKYSYVVLVTLLIISFIFFSHQYIDLNIKKDNGFLINGQNTMSHDCFVTDIEPLIQHLDSLDAEKINLIEVCVEPHIYVLYYLNVDPTIFRKGKDFHTMRYSELQNFGKWDFRTPDSPDDLIKDKNIIYVLDERNRAVIDERSFDIEEFSHYIIVKYKG